ncbi:branched-chain amino acid transaminase [uncultured Maricaulis sp.]|uniref:branched-chain amino acid transaminase n=1 Tax=uncultured Maricaulis sp. TaxID=174710 RepID=UPI0030D9021C
MAIQETDFIWRNGELIDWHEAQTHVLSHALHYGSSVFEGIRCYNTPTGPQIFRLTDHIKRLFNSARVYHMPINHTQEEVEAACRMVIRANHLKDAYIRPLAYFGYGGIGVLPGADTKSEICIAAFPWGAYLGEEALTKGVDCCISSWSRPAPNTIPTGAKAGGNYLSSMLISHEAHSRGFDEGIGLDVNGLVSEGAGENIFVVSDGIIRTPPSSSSILSGLTRDAVMKLAEAEGFDVREQTMSRESLYFADEIFFTGTAAEITPVRSVDGHVVRAGGRGPVAELMQARFFGLFSGETPDRHGWLQPVHDNAMEVQHVA